MPSDEESDEQQGQGLKIMTLKQLITRLPSLLAQLKAGNNSQKLKNEIIYYILYNIMYYIQIVYSLYRSKNLSESVYNNLVDTI